MRIYYVCNWCGPSGGIKVLYDHVRLLRRRGYDAALASYRRFERCIWFRNDAGEVPAIEDLRRHASPDDLIVVPEIAFADAGLRDCPGRRAGFIQNIAHVPRSFALADFDWFMVPSRTLGAWTRAELRWRGRIEIVPGFLESELLLGPRRWAGGPVRALVIARRDKHRGEPFAAVPALRSRGIAVTLVTGHLHRRDFVRLFRSHSLYLHLSHPEGFPTPVIEAYGAGCLVAGFAGIGGLEFMRDGENCLLARDGDWAAAVESAATCHTSAPGAYDGLLRMARTTAIAYDEARMERRLEEVFAKAGLPPAARQLP